MRIQCSRIPGSSVLVVFSWIVSSIKYYNAKESGAPSYSLLLGKAKNEEMGESNVIFFPAWDFGRGSLHVTKSNRNFFSFLLHKTHCLACVDSFFTLREEVGEEGCQQLLRNFLFKNSFQFNG